MTNFAAGIVRGLESKHFINVHSRDSLIKKLRKFVATNTSDGVDSTKCVK